MGDDGGIPHWLPSNLFPASEQAHGAAAPAISAFELGIGIGGRADQCPQAAVLRQQASSEHVNTSRRSGQPTMSMGDRTPGVDKVCRSNREHHNHAR